MKRQVIFAGLASLFILCGSSFSEKSGVKFDTDKDTLKPESFITLDEVGADILVKYKEDNALKIIISGHTDWRASNAYNLDLSWRRANTVKKYFMEKFGIPEANFETSGEGEERPIADNKTEEGMALNRRVEIEYAGKKLVLSSIIKNTETATATVTPTSEATVPTATNTPQPAPPTPAPTPKATEPPCYSSVAEIPVAEAETVTETVKAKMGVTFDTDKDTLKSESFIILYRVGTDLLKSYSEDNAMKIKITGHTDWRSSNKYNLGLSKRRSNTVKIYFMEQFKIPDANFETIGMGEEMPIADNKTEDGMATNRRVEVEYAGKKVVLSSVMSGPPAGVVTCTPEPSATPTPPERDNRLGFLVGTGFGLPFGKTKGAAYDLHAGRIGFEMSFAKRFGFTAEADAHFLYDNNGLVSDFGQFALGANYELLDGTFRPYLGLKFFMAKETMKNSSYLPGVSFEPGLRIFFNDYVSMLVSLETIGMASALVVTNLNFGIEVYTYRDNNWGWKYNKDEYKWPKNRDGYDDYVAPAATPAYTFTVTPTAAPINGNIKPAAAPTVTFTSTPVIGGAK